MFIMTGECLSFLYYAFHSKIVTFLFKRFYAGGGLGDEGYRYKKLFLEKLPIPRNIMSYNIDEQTADNIMTSLYRLSMEEIAFIKSQQRI